MAVCRLLLFYFAILAKHKKSELFILDMASTSCEGLALSDKVKALALIRKALNTEQVCEL